MTRIRTILYAAPTAMVLLLAACDSPTPATNTIDAAAAPQGRADNEVAPGIGAPPAAAPANDQATATSADNAPGQQQYLGRWTGVEGMYLDVAAKPGGGVTMTMQYDLDHKGTYDGSVTAEGLRFVRDGQAMTAVPTDGEATGLKWLSGKKNCLTVKPGEGYCR